MNPMKIIRSYDELKKWEYPEVVYKYRFWSDDSHRKILTGNELFLTPPSRFKDKMDCNLNIRFPQVNELYDFFYSKCDSNDIFVKQNFAKKWSQESPLANPIQRNKIINELKEELDKQFGVLSLSLTYDNDYMWEKYGNKNKGFCVGFYTKILLDTGFFSGGGYVQYCDKLPYIDFEKDDILTKFNKNIFSKRKNPYSQELEYRLTKRWDEEVGDKERAYKFPIESLSQIILGKNISKTDKDEIYDIQKTKYPNAQIIYM